MKYCTTKQGSPISIYSVLYSNQLKGTCSNTVPYSGKIESPRLFPVTLTSPQLRWYIQHVVETFKSSHGGLGRGNYIRERYVIHSVFVPVYLCGSPFLRSLLNQGRDQSRDILKGLKIPSMVWIHDTVRGERMKYLTLHPKFIELSWNVSVSFATNCTSK